MAKTISYSDEIRYARAKYGWTNNHIIFREVGDFYETYGNDAQIVHEICGATLSTHKCCGISEPMTGFPKHNNTYIPKLIRHGHPVAILGADFRFKTNNNNSSTQNNNNSSTQNKTIMKTYQSNINNDSIKYIHEDGALQAFKPLSVTYSPNDGYTLVAEIAGKPVTREVLSELPLAYESEDMYRKGVAFPMINVYNHSYFSNLLNPHDYWDDDIFYSDGGTVFSFPFEEMPVTFDYIKRKQYVGNIDRQHYASRDILMLVEDVKMVDEEGNQTIHKSLFSKIALSDTQKKAWENFVDAMNALHECGVSFVIDDENDNMYPVGGEEFTVNWRDSDQKHYTTVAPEMFDAVVCAADIKGAAVYCNMFENDAVYIRNRAKEETEE